MDFYTVVRAANFLVLICMKIPVRAAMVRKVGEGAYLEVLVSSCGNVGLFDAGRSTPVLPR